MLSFSIHTGTADTTQTGPSCRVWCELTRPDKCIQLRSVPGVAGTAGATAGRTPTQNALVWRSGRLNSHRLTRQDGPVCVVSGGRSELSITLVTVEKHMPANGTETFVSGLHDLTKRSDARISAIPSSAERAFCFSSKTWNAEGVTERPDE